MRIKWDKDVIGNYHSGIVASHFGMPSVDVVNAIIMPPRGGAKKYHTIVKTKYDRQVKWFDSLKKAKRWASSEMKFIANTGG